MPSTLEEHDWQTLLYRIKAGNCTPFLGAGACFGALPLGSDIAQRWATQHGYPLDDRGNLARVAQFIATNHDAMYPKQLLLTEHFAAPSPPRFSEPDEPHGVLADLRLPLYVTTNYDDFMMQALWDRLRTPVRELCRWNAMLKDHPSVLYKKKHDLSPASPVVFHLHGHDGVPASLVLTEDDYLDFLVNISRDPDLLPHQVRRALAGSSLLFIGYGLADWTFRVLFRGLVQATEASLHRMSVTVQLPVPQTTPQADAQEQYLAKYFGKQDIRVYWGTAREFAAELRQRWEAYRP